MRTGASPSAADAASSGAVSSAGCERWSLWSANSSLTRKGPTRLGTACDSIATARRPNVAIATWSPAASPSKRVMRRQRPAAAFVDEATRDGDRALVKRLLDACAVEVAGREGERALRVARDRELFEPERVDAGVTICECSELRFRNHLSDERRSSGWARSSRGRASTSESRPAAGTRATSGGSSMGFSAGGGCAGDPQETSATRRDCSDPNELVHLTTLTQAKRRFFEPTRSR